MPVTFIGDVHGQLAALEELLPQCQGTIIFMGDLIDRGPDSSGVVKCVRELCEADRAQCILGNHEYALVSSIGLPEKGIPANPDFFSAWCQVYGGYQTLLSYDVTEADLDLLRSDLRDDLEWMSELPWYLEGESDGRRFFVVHAGLNDREPFDLQVRAMADPKGWWDSTEQLPPVLYEHARAQQNPPDLDSDLCVVSGHTVQQEVVISDQRLLCDTSGGRPGRYLSGVIWPQGQVISAATASIE